MQMPCPVGGTPSRQVLQGLGTSITVADALEVFARGFSFTRSFTYPYIPERLQAGVWVIRDAPRVKGDYRGEEYVADGVEPSTLHEIAAKHTRGRYSLWAYRATSDGDQKMRADYKALGYRLLRIEPMFVHDLAELPDSEAPVPIVRVATPEQAIALAKAAGSRRVLPEHLTLDPAPQRQYVALDGETPIGWVASITAGAFTWCSSMHVVPEFRRRGIARALLARMLKDDRDAGSRANILLASQAGAKLYPVVGYRQIGMLYGYMPRARTSTN